MRVMCAVLVTFLAMSCVAASNAGPSGKPAPALSQQSQVDEVLDALDARGQDLRSFTADVRLSETDAATGDESTRIGKAWYQLDENGSARIRVAFDRKESGGKVSEDRIEYLLSGPDLVDRNYRGKTQVTRHVLKPGEKLNLFKLGEGPFPLPIGQRKEDVHAQFDVKKIDANPDDPKDTVHIRLTPKPDTRLERRFRSIDVWVDLSGHMPRRIETLDVNGSTIRTTDLTNVQVNPSLTDADFALPKIDMSEWQLIEEAYNE